MDRLLGTQWKRSMFDSVRICDLKGDIKSLQSTASELLSQCVFTTHTMTTYPQGRSFWVAEYVILWDPMVTGLFLLFLCFQDDPPT